MLGFFKKIQPDVSRSPDTSSKLNEGTEYQLIEVSEADDLDYNELVAVISAAIAASLNRSTHNLVVRSVKRIPAISPAWNRAARYVFASGYKPGIPGEESHAQFIINVNGNPIVEVEDCGGSKPALPLPGKAPPAIQSLVCTTGCSGFSA